MRMPICGVPEKRKTTKLNVLAAKQDAMGKALEVKRLFAPFAEANANPKERTTAVAIKTHSSIWLWISPTVEGEKVKPTTLFLSIGHQNAMPSVAKTIVLRSPFPIVKE